MRVCSSRVVTGPCYDLAKRNGQREASETSNVLGRFCAWKLSSISAFLRVPVCHKSHSGVLASVLKDNMLTRCVAVAACQIFHCTSQDAIKCSRKKIACLLRAVIKKTPHCLF